MPASAPVFVYRIVAPVDAKANRNEGHPGAMMAII
jgi:hypothetical protein